MSTPLTLRSYDFSALALPADAPARALFAPLQHLPWAMLLESASADHPDSRFDILVAAPRATLTTHGNDTSLQRDGQAQPLADDAFSALQQAIHDHLPACNYHGELPFVGGALGLWGYDLGRQLERMPALASADVQIPDMAIGLYNWAWVLDHTTQQAHLLVLGDETAWQARWEWWQQQTVQTSAGFILTGDWQSNLDQAAYAACFEQIQHHLAIGDCYQINLTQRFSATYRGSEWQAYCLLSAHNRAPFSAFIRLPQAAILSLSPERFLALDGRQVSTKPIKGTRPRHADPVQDVAARDELANAPKDRAENLMIVDLLRNDIGRVCRPGSVQVPALFAIESFPAVHHLVSTITGELADGLDGLDLLRACFPGGSITGAPKIRAMEIIEQLEPHRRNGYCGSIGYVSVHGRMDTSITIRTLLAEQGRLYVWAGGGIVADSQVDDEYQETFHKLGRILPVLGKVQP